MSSNLVRSSSSNSNLVSGINAAIESGAKEVEVKTSRNVLDYRIGYGPFSYEKYHAETESFKISW
jgi:hypothetical protein